MQALALPLPRNGKPAAADEELLGRYRDARDPEAFAALVHRYEAPLYHYLVRYLHRAELAEEALQATFLRVHQKCHLFNEGSVVRPWLYRIATNQAIDALRREGRQHAVSLDDEHAAGEVNARSLSDLLESSSASPLDRMEAQERAEWTRRAIDALPDRLRLAVLLVFFQGLKYHEAAQVLQVPLGTVKSRIHQALLMLHRAWRRNHFAE